MFHKEKESNQHLFGCDFWLVVCPEDIQGIYRSVSVYRWVNSGNDEECCCVTAGDA